MFEFRHVSVVSFLVCLLMVDAWAERPNILVILSDDQGFGDLARHGNKVVETPRLDQLFAESFELTQFHAAPVCAPTRASLMTGKQFLRTGVWGVHGGRDYLDLRETTVAERLQKSGYRTAMAGKWHLGKTDAYMPYNRGFDEAWPIVDRLYMHTDPVIDHNGEIERPRGWTVDILTDYLLDWMDNGDDRPFFAYLAHPYIHEPYYAPELLIEKYRKKGLSDSFARLCAMTEHLDQATGRLMDALEERGLSGNTVVFFLGDNGPIGNPVNVPHLTKDEMASRNPLGLKGVKGNLYENGTRVPFMVRWPEVFKAQVSDHEADITDVVPTLLDLVGIDYKEVDFDGRSLTPLFKGDVEKLNTPVRYYANHEVVWPGRKRLYDFLEDRNVLSFEDQVLSLRVGDLKYVMGFGNRELYNIAHDPKESENLVSLYPEKSKKLHNQLREWWETNVFSDSKSYSMPVFPLPSQTDRSILLHPCAPSEIFGNVVQGSHFSHQWRSSGDGIGFAVKVENSGDYQVKIDADIEERTGELLVSVSDEMVQISLENSDSGNMGTMSIPEGEHRLLVKLVRVEGDSVKIENLKAVHLTRL